MSNQGIQLHLPSREATHALGVVLGRSLSTSTTLLLQGDLGSGKTTLVQGLGLGLGITDAIVSPTFTLINEYLEGRMPLYHLDLYRLEPTEADELQIDLYWDGIEVPPGIVAIEWAERLSVYPQSYLKFSFQQMMEGDRQLNIQQVGACSPALTALLQQWLPNLHN